MNAKAKFNYSGSVGWTPAGSCVPRWPCPRKSPRVLARLVFDGDLDAKGVASKPGPIWPDSACSSIFAHAEDGLAVAAITTQLRRRHPTDSTYVRLAQQLDTQLWTLDGPLARNVADLGLAIRLVA